MNAIRLHPGHDAARPGTPPVFALSCNYDHTAKYVLQSRQVDQAALTVLFRADSLILLPRGDNGRAMAAAMAERLPLRADDGAAWRLDLSDAAGPREKLARLLALPKLFDADDRFGLYGFFTYELAHAADADDDELLGVFHLPQRLRVDGVEHGYWMAPDARDAGDEPLRLERWLDLDAFAAGDGAPYADMYRLARRQIDAGALRSLNPSFAIRRPAACDGWGLHRKLLDRSRAPYQLFFDGGGFQLAGASPAMFLRLRDGRLETSPICGTAARGRDADEDSRQIARLLASDKDRFELEECVRADMAAKRGCGDDIRLLAEREIEQFPNVFHTSAHVVATLKPGLDEADAICDHLWPATIVGTPAAAAIRLLAGHEKRHWYGGAFGYVTAGETNLGTVIRSALLRGGSAFTRVGSTVTRHSSPEQEQDELDAKAKLILEAL
ncbi:chorismate-binding protein [Chromobacterium vaccinii]|uniref:chorismate-binding protein n=1 Tax=Chromobacterium vaccinii TaxID=1108595 RepID=UPI003C71AE8F